MNPIPTSAVYATRIAQHLANAAAALRVADTQLGLAAELPQLDLEDLLAARFNARHFAGVLDATRDAIDDIDATPRRGPSMEARRVFRALAKRRNRHPNNSPAVEASILALRLAARSLDAALTLADQLDGDDVAPAYQAAFAAHGTIWEYIGVLSSLAFVFDENKALEELVSSAPPARRRLALSA